MDVRGAKCSSVRCKDNDRRANKIEERNDEMLLASVCRGWDQTCSQIVSEVRNHRDEKIAIGVT